MKTSILIVTHLNDMQWFVHCLYSIHKFATGFHEVVVIIPSDEFVNYSKLISDCPMKNVRWVQYDQPPVPLHFLSHEVQKCKADIHCPEADSILHIDSDVIFKVPVTPNDFSVDGKPVLLKRLWSSSGHAMCWKPHVDRALNVDSKYETMCWMTISHVRQTYSGTRQAIENVHNRSFEHYVYSQNSKHPFGFTEFNTLGTFALNNNPEQYHIIDVTNGGWPEVKAVQFWSYGGLDRVLVPGDCTAYTGKTPREVINSILY